MTETELAALCAAITPPDEAARRRRTPTGPALQSRWAGWADWKRPSRTPPPSPAAQSWIFPPGGAGALRR